MPIDNISISSIQKEMKIIFSDFGCSKKDVIPIETDVNYFELENPMFSLAYRYKLLVEEKEKPEIVLNLLGNKAETDAIELIKNYIRNPNSVEIKIPDSDKLNEKFVGFSGLKIGETNKKAFYVNKGATEYKDQPDALEHLVTHEFLHFHANGGGLHDWKNDEFSIDTKFGLDEGVTELMARIITYRRQKNIMLGASNIPKYELYAQVVNKIIDLNGAMKKAIGEAYFNGQWDNLNELLQKQDFKELKKIKELLEVLSHIEPNMTRTGSDTQRKLLDLEILPETGTDKDWEKAGNAWTAWKGSFNSGTYSDPIRSKTDQPQQGIIIKKFCNKIL